VNKQEDELIAIGMGIDQHAVLFKTSDKIIRAIKPEYTDFYLEVLENAVIQQLMEDNVLINTKISSIKIEGYELVFEHPLLSIVSFPFEWTPNMFRDASIAILKFNIELLKVGYCTQDAHPWNVLFDGTTPTFIDFTSIVKALPENRWVAINEFHNYCFNPLCMMSRGYPTVTRKLLNEILNYPDPIFVNELVGKNSNRLTFLRKAYQRAKNGIIYFAKRLPSNYKASIRKWLEFFIPKKKINKVGGLINIQRILGEIEGLSLTPPREEWSGYYSGKNELPVYDGQTGALDTIIDSTPKHSIVNKILKNIKPQSVLDMGCNRGLYSQMAALLGSRVIGIDVDERTLDDMYLDSKRLKTNSIPLFINAVAPVEAIGFKESPFPSVEERLRSELVMCLALVHHLVFKRTRMSFAHIAKLFNSYSEKYLLVEFVPKEDIHVQSWYSEDFYWYSLDNFKLALSEYFGNIEVFESFPNPRVILFCEKSNH